MTKGISAAFFVFSVFFSVLSVTLWLVNVLLADLGEDVAFPHDLDFPAVHFDVAAGVTAVNDLIALLHGQGGALPVVVEFAGPNRQNAATLWFLLGAVGQQNAAGRHLLGLQRLNHDPIIQ